MTRRRLFQGGDYFKCFRQWGAINRGTAIIRENTVCSFSMYKDKWGISVNDGANGKISCKKKPLLARKSPLLAGKKASRKIPVLAGLAGIILMKVILRQEDDKRKHARISLNCDSHYFILR